MLPVIMAASCLQCLMLLTTVNLLFISSASGQMSKWMGMLSQSQEQGSGGIGGGDGGDKNGDSGSVDVNDVPGYSCNSKMCKDPHTKSGKTWDMPCKIQDGKEYVCVPFVIDKTLGK